MGSHPLVTNNSLQITLPASVGGTLYMGLMGGAFTSHQAISKWWSILISVAAVAE